MTSSLLAQVSFAPMVWTLLGLCGVMGLLAIVSPSRFSKLTSHSSTWIDTDKLLSKLDTRVDIDKYVLPFSRVLGASVLVAVATIAFVYWNYRLR